MNTPSPSEPISPTVDQTQALFNYWSDKVEIKSLKLLHSEDHLPAYKLRHACTNYDQLRESLEVQQLPVIEQTQAITIIKYQCTTKVLQRRAGILRQRSQTIQQELDALNQLHTENLNWIERLKRLLFSRDTEIKQLKTQISLLQAEKEELELKTESSQADAELHEALKKIEKELETERKRRQELGRNNQSLGGRVAHTERYKRQRDEAREKVTELEQVNWTLQNELNQLKGLPPLAQPKKTARKAKNTSNSMPVSPTPTPGQ